MRNSKKKRLGIVGILVVAILFGMGALQVKKWNAVVEKNSATMFEASLPEELSRQGESAERAFLPTTASMKTVPSTESTPLVTSEMTIQTTLPSGTKRIDIQKEKISTTVVATASFSTLPVVPPIQTNTPVVQTTPPAPPVETTAYHANAEVIRSMMIEQLDAAGAWTPEYEGNIGRGYADAAGRGSDVAYAARAQSMIRAGAKIVSLTVTADGDSVHYEYTTQ